MATRYSPAVTEALAVALEGVCHTKGRMVTQMEKAGVPEAMVRKHNDWRSSPAAGRELVTAIVTELNESADGEGPMRKLAAWVMQHGAGPNLGEPTVQALSDLETGLRSYDGRPRAPGDAMAQEDARASASVRAVENARSDRFARFREQLVVLQAEGTPSVRLKGLREVLRGLLETATVHTTEEFRIAGGAVVGAFPLDERSVRVYASWQETPIGRTALDALIDAGSHLAAWPVALVIEMAGFTTEAAESPVTRSSTTIVGFDGEDMMAVLDARVGFLELVRWKVARAGEVDRFFSSARTFAGVEGRA